MVESCSIWGIFLFRYGSSETSEGYEDKIHVIISERLIDVSKYYAGKLVKITGELHSYNRAGAEMRNM